MRAVGFTQPGSADVLEVLEVPEPSGDGLLIEVAAAAVNPVDIATRSGQIPTSGPTVLGWDLAGTVLRAPNGSGFSVGDRVMAMTAPLGTGVGSMAERVVFDPAFTVRIPDELSTTEAAALPLAGVTAIQVLRAASVQNSQRILLIGPQGSVGGQIAARLLGRVAADVDLLVRPGDHDVWATSAATRVLSAVEDLEADVYDVVIDTGGVPETLRGVVPGGNFITITPFSAPTPDAREDVTIEIPGVELDLDDLREAAEFAASNPTHRPTTSTMPFDGAAQAHRLIEHGGFRGKIVLVP